MYNLNSQIYTWDFISFLIFSPLVFYSFEDKRNLIRTKKKLESDTFFLLGEKIFLILVFFNLVGLLNSWLPVQIFPLILFSLSFCLWSTAIITWINFRFLGFFKHHTPQGLSFFLGPVIALIEIIRTFLRPIILRLRLMANILGGHLMTELTWDIANYYPALLFLSLYENFICVIQSIIFSLLATDYYIEVNL